MFLRKVNKLSARLLPNTSRWSRRKPPGNFNGQHLVYLVVLSAAGESIAHSCLQRAKYSSPQLTTNCIAAIRCLWYYVKLIWESLNTEDTNFPPSLKKKSSRMAFSVEHNSKFSERQFFQLLQYSGQHPSNSIHRAALMSKKWLIFNSIFLMTCRLRSSILLFL